MNGMAHHEADKEMLEQLTLYSLDLLGTEEARAIERHLAQGCPDCEAELAGLRETITTALASAPAREAPAHLRQQVLGIAQSDRSARQIWKKWADTPGAGLQVIRHDEGDWETVAPGVTARQLYVDRERDTVTMIVRMEPGSTYWPHRHGGPEQCFVIEGDISEGGNTFRAGDFQFASKDSVHGVQSTEEGCVLLIVSSLHDELLR
jgi:anti-sigma factor ChrR (cupin superfamily)